MTSRSKSRGLAHRTPRTLLIKSGLDEVSLHPVALSDRLAIKQLTLDPEQEQFVGSVETIFDTLHSSCYPDLEHPFAIVVREKTVGFFILRERQALPEWAPCDVVTLHRFRICRACQGKGYGRAGADLAILWVQLERAGVRHLMLAVNARNVLAKSLYLKAGFLDTGQIFRGPIGDQNILAVEIPRHGG